MFDEFMMLVEACDADVVLGMGRDGVYRLTFDDFEGFDDDWSEVDREYDHPAEVEALGDWMDEHCDHTEGDFYVTYFFDGFAVMVAYTSMDI